MFVSTREGREVRGAEGLRGSLPLPASTLGWATPASIFEANYL